MLRPEEVSDTLDKERAPYEYPGPCVLEPAADVDVDAAVKADA